MSNLTKIGPKTAFLLVFVFFYVSSTCTPMFKQGRGERAENNIMGQRVNSHLYFFFICVNLTCLLYTSDAADE